MVLRFFLFVLQGFFHFLSGIDPSLDEHGKQFVGKLSDGGNECVLLGLVARQNAAKHRRKFLFLGSGPEGFAHTGLQPDAVNTEDAADVRDCTVTGDSISFFNHPNKISKIIVDKSS